MNPDRDVTRPRPNPLHPYQCGFNEIGSRCTTGPTIDGQCCQSIHGGCDKADCGRDCNESGACEISGQKRINSEVRQHFQTCIPQRSPWNWRNLVAGNLAILASGILLVLMCLPHPESIFVPGELSPSHAQILENTLVSERCSMCHPNSHGFANKVTQEQLCLNCHQAHMPDALPGNPHDLTKPQFSVLASFHNASGGGPQTIAEDQSVTKCAQCHVEHHGNDRDLKAITDARCQSCHQQQFSSFSSNHPEFRKFPNYQPRRIAFDHVAHSEKYYAQKNTSFDCKKCHEFDSLNPSHILRTASFEVACAACHSEPLKASSGEGWAMLQLPSLNSNDLVAGEEMLTNWPTAALYGYDGKILLPMRLLLSSDDKVAEALSHFSTGDLSEVPAGDARRQAAARSIAAGVRQLLLETAALGQDAWKNRLTTVAVKALQRQPTPQEVQLIRAMVIGLPPDLFRQMENSWFGKPPSIVNGHSGSVAATLVASTLSAPQELLDESDLTLNGESAADLLRGSSTQGLTYRNQPPNAAPQARPPQHVGATPQSAQVNLSSEKAGVSAVKNNDLLEVEDDGLSVDELLSLPSANPSSQGAGQTRPPTTGSVGKLTASRLVGEGGWYLDHQLLMLKYMPSGHADPVVAAWVQFAALIDSRDSAEQHRAGDSQQFIEAAQPWHSPNWQPGKEAVGGCTECHLLPNYTLSDLAISDWRSAVGSTEKYFTKFNHKPHMTLAATADCKHCHQFGQSTGGYAQLTKTIGSQSTRLVHYRAAQQHFSCEFKAMEKSQCNACHRAGGASEGCTQCHNYHIGTGGFEAIQQAWREIR